MQDKELRERFDEWAGPLRATRAPAIAALHSRIRRRMTRIAAAAGSALAVVGLVAGLLTVGGLAASRRHGAPGPQNGPTAPGKYPASLGQPYVFVNSSATLLNQGNVPTTPAELRNMATGKVVKVLRPVGQGVSFTNVAAAPSDRAFVLAQQDSDGTISFAEIRIGPSGEAGPLRAVLPGLSMSAGTQVENMAVNAAGTRLSFFAALPNGNGGTNPTILGLAVYNLDSGAVIGRWPTIGNGFALSQFLGNGNELVVTCPWVEHGRNRLIDASTPFRSGSSLLADSRPGPARGIPGSFTQDGKVFTNAIYDREPPSDSGGSGGAAGGGQASATLILKVVSAATGKLLEQVPIGPASAVNGPYFCGALLASANGHELLTQCGTRQLDIVVGKYVRQIRLPWLLPTNPALATATFAW